VIEQHRDAVLHVPCLEEFHGNVENVLIGLIQTTCQVLPDTLAMQCAFLGIGSSLQCCALFFTDAHISSPHWWGPC